MAIPSPAPSLPPPRSSTMNEDVIMAESSPPSKPKDYVERVKLASGDPSTQVIVTLDTVNPVDSYSKTPLPFLKATQKCRDGSSMPVYAKIYPKGKSLEGVYKSLLACTHKNVLKVLSRTSQNGMDVIAFEPVACTLYAYVQSNEIFTADDPERITEFLPDMQVKIRSIIAGLCEFHSHDIQHGAMSALDIFLTYDGDVKLGLKNRELEICIAKDGATSKLSDPADPADPTDPDYLADLIVAICKQKNVPQIDALDCPQNFLEISDLVKKLRAWDGKTNFVIHGALCTPNDKWFFLSTSFRLLGSKADNAMSVDGWREHFTKGINSLPSGFRKYEDDTFKSFYRFIKNVPEHLYGKGSGAVRVHFGRTQEKAIRKIQMFKPLLFVELMKLASDEGVLEDAILKESDGTGVILAFGYAKKAEAPKSSTSVAEARKSSTSVSVRQNRWEVLEGLAED